MKYFIILIILFLELLIPVTIIAQSFEVDGIYFSINNDSEVAVTSGTNPYTGIVKIPSSVISNGKTYTVTSIAPFAFYGCSGLTGMTIPNSVITIGVEAFEGCSALTFVSIPNSVKSIGFCAFAGCTSLTSITVPNSVETIGESAFYGCTNLTRVDIFDLESWCKIAFGLSMGEYGDVDYIDSRCSCNPLYYARHLYLNGIEVKDLIIPETVTRINDFSFAGGVFDSIKLQQNLSVGGGAFCSAEIGSISDTIEDISCAAFYRAHIPKLIVADTRIPRYAFGESRINYLETNFQFFDYSAFRGGYFDTLVCKSPTPPSYIPDEEDYGHSSTVLLVPVHSIELYKEDHWWSQFRDIQAYNDFEISGISYYYKGDNEVGVVSCSLNGNVSIPDTVSFDGTEYAVTEICENAFSDCDSLMSITIPKTIIRIGSKAFKDCNGLTSVFISDLFAWCHVEFSDLMANPLYYAHHIYLNGQEIKSLMIPNGVTVINDFVFVNGSAIDEVTFPNSLSSIGCNAFENCTGLSSLSFPSSVETIGAKAFRACNKLTKVSCASLVPPAMGDIDCFDDMCYDRATLFVPGNRVEDYKHALYWNKFENIVGTGIEVDGIYYQLIPSTNEAIVTFRDENYCSYTGEVTIPEEINYGGTVFTVTAIGDDAFAYCNELSNVSIPGTIVSIGASAFMNCENITSLTIPNSVMTIAESAFDGCGGLTAIEIPNSVTTIGAMSFQGCTSLVSLTIGDGVLFIGAKAFKYCNALNTVTCYGNVPPLMENANCFTTYGYRATLRVPHNAVEVYRYADYWNKFILIEGYGSAGLGDVNGDGVVNIQDVASLINAMLNYDVDSIFFEAGDLNNNGRIDIGDVTSLIYNLLQGS